MPVRHVDLQVSLPLKTEVYPSQKWHSIEAQVHNLQQMGDAVPQDRQDLIQGRLSICLNDIAQGSCCIFPDRKDIVIQQAEPEQINVLHICFAFFWEG